MSTFKLVGVIFLFIFLFLSCDRLNVSHYTVSNETSNSINPDFPTPIETIPVKGDEGIIQQDPEPYYLAKASPLPSTPPSIGNNPGYSESPAPTPSPSTTPVASSAPSPIPSPVSIHYIFASSRSYDGNLGGIDGADLKCQTLADNANLSGNWKAMLSTETVNVKDRIQINGIVRNNVIGNTNIAVNAQDLWDGHISDWVHLDEYGNSAVANGLNRFVHSGSTDMGYKIPGSTCNSWTSNSSSLFRKIGTIYWNQGGTLWLGSPWDTPCSAQYRIYCINQ